MAVLFFDRVAAPKRGFSVFKPLAKSPEHPLISNASPSDSEQVKLLEPTSCADAQPLSDWAVSSRRFCFFASSTFTKSLTSLLGVSAKGTGTKQMGRHKVEMRREQAFGQSLWTLSWLG